MPPKIKYSREEIIDKAFAIAKQEGLSNITIRKVAERLKSSVAPIYVNFESIDDLTQAVVEKTLAISQEILAEQSSGHPFKDIGLASLRFAKDYPVLFRDLALNQSKYMQNNRQEMNSMLVEEMKNDRDLEGFTEEELLDILVKMEIFQTGLSLMVSNGLVIEEKAIKLLEDTATDVVLASRIRAESKSGV